MTTAPTTTTPENYYDYYISNTTHLHEKLKLKKRKETELNQIIGSVLVRTFVCLCVFARVLSIMPSTVKEFWLV
jgi:hypothetical protein